MIEPNQIIYRNQRMNDPFRSLFDEMISEASRLGASDIHIEPKTHGAVIRYRILGDMSLPWQTIDSNYQKSFFNTVKRRSGLSIAISGRPQDGRCSANNVDLRVSLLPTLHGEKIVMRLLDKNKEFGIDAIGFDEDTKKDLLDALEYKNGVVLISGPTGSGKTTTLYSLLCEIDHQTKNIITLEDPVEYTLPGITQVKIDPKVSFSLALRAVLRQDPDVILVGEIRDEETAKLAFKAAATGHLVLSTVHANGAKEVVDRLINLGIDKDTLKANFRFSAAQRLMQRLCENCSIHAPNEILSEIANWNFEAGKFRIRNTTGCDECDKGIIGRLPILEYMSEEQISEYLEGNQLAKSDQIQTLQENAMHLARMGLVDLKEAYYAD